MTNTPALEEKIRKCGYKKTWIAGKLGLSPTGLWKKMRGEREFKISEVLTLSELLDINTMDEVTKIFFA